MHTAVITVHWEDGLRKQVRFTDKVDEAVIKAVNDEFAESLTVNNP